MNKPPNARRFFKRLIFTDFDGTLYNRETGIHPENIDTLRRLARSDFARVLATGRNVYSCEQINEDLECLFDYLIFSTGAGVMDLRNNKIILSHSLSADDVSRIVCLLCRCRLSFMMIGAIPDSRYFYYLETGSRNIEFEARFDLYRQWAQPVSLSRLPRKICNFLIFVPSRRKALFKQLREELADFSVILSASPLGGEFKWIEIFPAGVDKGNAAAWLAERLKIKSRDSMAVGNDFNDSALLSWVDAPYVVANAEPELIKRHRQVGRVEKGGFAQAVADWLARQGLSKLIPQKF